MNPFQTLMCFIKTRLMTEIQKDLEIAGLRSQFVVFQQHIITRLRLNNRFRRLWIFLSKYLQNWQDTIMLVKPETVLHWHRRAFKFYWRRKSVGRPKISSATIALTKRIHRENPTLSPEKIHERLIHLNITDAPAPNTIAKYIKTPRTPPTQKQVQSWTTFLRNHNIWSMDFAVVPTLTFKALYVLLIISLDRRKIEHFSVTEEPTAQWLIQQIRNTTPFGKQPKYLLHDNGSVFKCALFQRFLANVNIISKSITPRCPWQNGICERLVGIVRRELLDYIIPINQRHLERLLAEYVDYYNNVRTHQALDGETSIKATAPPETSVVTTKLTATPILGGLYHDYQKVARAISSRFVDSYIGV